MDFVPQSTIRILRNVPLDNSYNDTITFGSASAQSSYFSSLTKYTINGCTYLREESVLRIPKIADDLFDCNYIMFQNSNYDSRWFYAFITHIEYKSQNTSYITFEIDVMQTWKFDFTVQPSFVVREHVSDDTIGANLVDENLETGDYIANGTAVPANIGLNMWILVGSTVALDWVDNTSARLDGGMYSNVFSGVAYYAFSPAECGTLIALLKKLSAAGKADAISSISMIPFDILPSGTASGSIVPRGVVSPGGKQITFTKKLTTIDGYTPKNKKLFTYPFNLLHANNNNGNSADFKYEYFSEDPVTFSIWGNVAPCPTVFMIPLFYRGIPIDNESRLSLENFPMCNWTIDAFSNWLAQNTAGIGLGVLSSAFALGIGNSTGNPMAVASGAIGIASELGSIAQHAIQPPQAKGSIVAGGANCAGLANDFILQPLSIRAEFAQRIDKYFDMFGYKVGTVKVPNMSTRPHWNYVKTIDCHITGSVPLDGMSKIKSIFNNGVTFWKSGSEVGNYNLDNSI
jgi:hypothetical protein